MAAISHFSQAKSGEDGRSYSREMLGQHLVGLIAPTAVSIPCSALVQPGQADRVNHVALSPADGARAGHVAGQLNVVVGQDLWRRRAKGNDGHQLGIVPVATENDDGASLDHLRLDEAFEVAD